MCLCERVCVSVCVCVRECVCERECVCVCVDVRRVWPYVDVRSADKDSVPPTLRRVWPYVDVRSEEILDKDTDINVRWT